MDKTIKKTIKVQDNIIRIMNVNGINYISLTDLATYVNGNDPSGVIRNWMSSKNSFSFYSLWEELNNPNFNSVESHRIKIKEVPYNRFTMTPSRWKKEFNSIGIVPSVGKYSKGTYAHPDIAFEFASWLSPEFKLYLITEFERLKQKETLSNKEKWEASRFLTKVNYKLQTDTIKNYVVPLLTEKQKKYVYENEADLLNVALFGITAKEWKKENPNLKGSLRDYANVLYLIVLGNLEAINSEMLLKGITQEERLIKLNDIARRQIDILKRNKNIGLLDKTKNVDKLLINNK